MTDLRQAAQQALEALETLLSTTEDVGRSIRYDTSKAITALRSALEQQHAEPVAWDKPGASFAGLTLTEVRVPFGMTIRFEGGALIVETIHNVKEGKTPAFISCDAHGNIISKERNHD